MVHKYNGSHSTTKKNEICRKIKFAEKSVQLESITLSKINPGSDISLYADPGLCYLNGSKDKGHETRTEPIWGTKKKNCLEGKRIWEDNTTK